MRRLVIGVLCIGFLLDFMLRSGSWGKNYNVAKGAGFVSLARGAKSYEGSVQDESSTYKLKDLCFGGLVKIGGIRKEGDDSSSEIDMKSVKELEVIQGRFQSKDPRHSKTREYPLFAKVRVTFKTGASEEYLFPYDMVISGVDLKTETGKAWYLRDINGVKVKGEHKRRPKSKPVIPARTAKTPWWKQIVSF
ncbi:hypothetical protein ACFLY6_01670 [Candidatus Dependentiae bacterium]